jgi:predicted metal-dependent phosphoesterase TrpH
MDRQKTGLADLHIHTTASDGFATIQEVLDHLAKLKVFNVIAITDHDVLDASLWAYSQRSHYAFEIIPGVEVSSADGHVLGLWVTQPIPMGMSLAETVAAIHEQQGIAILAHPFEITVCSHTFRRYLSQPEVVREAGVDAIEVHNAGTLTPGSNALARWLARTLDLPVVGGSDAHSLKAIGRGRTRYPGSTEAELRSALLRKETTAEGQSWPAADYLGLLPHWLETHIPLFAGARKPAAPPHRS